MYILHDLTKEDLADGNNILLDQIDENGNN